MHKKSETMLQYVWRDILKEIEKLFIIIYSKQKTIYTKDTEMKMDWNGKERQVSKKET